MLKDKNTNLKIGFDIPTKYLILIAGGLALLGIGIFSLAALGSASLMF